jgi:hypothetical protein
MKNVLDYLNSNPWIYIIVYEILARTIPTDSKYYSILSLVDRIWPNLKKGGGLHIIFLFCSLVANAQLNYNAKSIRFTPQDTTTFPQAYWIRGTVIRQSDTDSLYMYNGLNADSTGRHWELVNGGSGGGGGSVNFANNLITLSGDTAQLGGTATKNTNLNLNGKQLNIFDSNSQIYEQNGYLDLESFPSSGNGVGRLEIFPQRLTITATDTSNQGTYLLEIGKKNTASSNGFSVVTGTVSGGVSDRLNIDSAGRVKITPIGVAGTNGKVFTSDANGFGTWQTPSSGSPAGSNTQIQYNNSGAFGASSSFTWDNTNKILAMTGAAPTLDLNGSSVGVLSSGSGDLELLIAASSKSLLINNSGSANNLTFHETPVGTWNIFPSGTGTNLKVNTVSSTSSGGIQFVTGNASTTASGDITLQTGTAVGTRGSIVFNALNLNNGLSRWLAPNGSGSGDPNLFFGQSAGVTSPTNGYNIAIGASALNNLTSGQFNTAIGAFALNGSTTANQNTAIGYLAIGNNFPVTGGNNVAIGRAAMQNVNSGSLNVAIGDAAGNSLTTGTQNTFVGRISGLTQTTANNNTFIGYTSGSANTSGNQNTFIGSGAGSQNTTGSDNLYAGFQAGAETTINGNRNVFLGSQVIGENQLTSNDNVAVGYNALGLGFTSGSFNNVFGSQAASSITSGQYNIVFGYKASMSDDPTVAIKQGSQNVAIGYRANVADSSGNGQLSIQNAIYGKSNTLNVTGDAIATGFIGFYNKVPTYHVDIKGTTANSDLIFNVAKSDGNSAINVSTTSSGVLIIKLPNLPTSCSGLATGTLANVATVLTICP